MPLEKTVSQLPGLRRIFADFGASYAVAAFVAFLFAASGPVAIILSVGARGGLSESDIASWIFAAFCINSVISIAFTLAYRQPLIFLWSIPGTQNLQARCIRHQSVSSARDICEPVKRETAGPAI